MSTFRRYWERATSSLWFIPALIVGGAIGLAIALLQLDRSISRSTLEALTPLFHASAEGSRGLLTAIATSMITVAGVTFSITVVALSLASSQYTSRVLRNFMRDTANQVVLGVFVGIFAYCMVVLPSIHSDDGYAFVPVLAVFTASVLALVGVVFFIYFIHHIASAVQASSILAAVSEDTARAIDRLFPHHLGEEGEAAPETVVALAERAWRPLRSRSTGYLQAVDTDSLLQFASRRRAIVRMERAIGDFVAEGAPLAFWTADLEPHAAPRGRPVNAADSAAPESVAAEKEFNAAYDIDDQRTIEQDAGFGIRQIVDVALKSLSPGINDTTTAVMCVDRLGWLLGRLANRRIESPFRLDQGRLRVIVRGPTFASLLSQACGQIRQNAAGNIAVLARQLQTLSEVVEQTSDRSRKRLVTAEARLLAELADASIACPQDREGVAAEWRRFLLAAHE